MLSNGLRFNGVCSSINLEEYKSIGTHWTVLYVNGDNVTCFDNFGVEYIPKEINNFIGIENILTNIYSVQAYTWIMCGYVCIGFIDFMMKSKSLLDCNNLFYFLLMDMKRIKK